VSSPNTAKNKYTIALLMVGKRKYIPMTMQMHHTSTSAVNFGGNFLLVS